MADLIRRQGAVIVVNQGAVESAKSATTTIPIVFVTGGDPVRLRLGSNLRRPGGNLTGVTFSGGVQLSAKRVELLHDLAPTAGPIGVPTDPSYLGSGVAEKVIEDAVRALGGQSVAVKAAVERDLEPAFAGIVRAGAAALVVNGAPFFTSERRRIVALAARHRLPTIYGQRDYVSAGDLISYSASFTDAYRHPGVYAGRVLKGAKPSELPVMQPTAFELAVNLKTAKALGRAIPPSVLARADEVIQ